VDLCLEFCPQPSKQRIGISAEFLIEQARHALAEARHVEPQRLAIVFGGRQRDGDCVGGRKQRRRIVTAASLVTRTAPMIDDLPTEKFRGQRRQRGLQAADRSGAKTAERNFGRFRRRRSPALIERGTGLRGRVEIKVRRQHIGCLVVLGFGQLLPKGHEVHVGKRTARVGRRQTAARAAGRIARLAIVLQLAQASVGVGRSQLGGGSIAVG